MNNLEQLISAYCDGRINREELETLEAELKRSPEARKQLLDYMNTDAGIMEIVDEELEIIEFPVDSVAESKQGSRRRMPSYWMYAAILIIVLNLVLWMRSKDNQSSNQNLVGGDQQLEEELYVSNAVAQVTRVVDVDWGDATERISGNEVEVGLFEFESGLVQLEFFSGATMVLQGPAEIDVKSSMEVACLTGKMHVKVPESAHGFVVDTGKMQVRDLGTEFAIQVLGNKREIHLLEGEVEIFQDGKRLKSLLKNDSVAWTSEESVLSEVDSNDDFVTYRNIDQYDQTVTAKRHQQWKDYMAELSRRDDLVLLYDFDSHDNWQRTLLNREAGKTGDGALIGVNWTEGRWKGKTGVEFKSISDRIRLNVSGEYKALTMATWVRVHSFDRWLSSLLLTDDFNTGALHWQLSDKGEMIVGARFKSVGATFEDVAYNAYTPKLLGPEDFGRWVHFAMVYDPNSQKVNQYLNGELVHAHDIPVLQTIKLGNCEIGNWSKRSGENGLRSLNGRMDEFMIFSSAFDSQQIKELYLNGKP